MIQLHRQQTLQWIDTAIFCALCPVFYFLPISIALVESFSGLVIFLFLIERYLLLRWGLSKSRSFFCEIISSMNSLRGPLLFFVGTVFLSVVFSQYRWESLVAFFGKTMEGVLLFIILIDKINSIKRTKILVGIILFSGLLLGLSGIFQHFTGWDFIRGNVIHDGRIDATFRHANDFGTFILVISLLVMAFFLTYVKDKKVSILFGGFLIFLLIVLALTFSRGAWLGLLCGAVFMIMLNKRRGWLIILIVLSFYLAAVPFLKSSRAFDFKHDLYAKHQGNVVFLMDFFKEVTSSGRGVYWEKAVVIINSAPVFGTGLNTYTKVVQRYPSVWGGGYPHNCYLQMTAESGFVGLFGFFVFIFALLFEVIRVRKNINNLLLKAMTYGSSAALVGFLVQSFFDTTFYSVQLGNLMWLIMGLAVAAKETDAQAVSV